MVDYSSKNNKEIDELYELLKSNESREAMKQKAMEDIDNNFKEIEKEYEKRHAAESNKAEEDIKCGTCFMKLYNVSKSEGEKPFTAVSFYVVTDVKDNGEVLCNIHTMHLDENDYRMDSRYRASLTFPIKMEMHICDRAIKNKVVTKFQTGHIEDIYKLLKPFYNKDIENIDVCKEAVLTEDIEHYPVGTILKSSKYDGISVKMLFETIDSFDKDKNEYSYSEHYMELGSCKNIASYCTSKKKKHGDFSGVVCKPLEKEILVQLFDEGKLNDILKHEDYEYDNEKELYKPACKGYNDIACHVNPIRFNDELGHYSINPTLSDYQIGRIMRHMQKTIDSTLNKLFLF